jgi:hypothetical protein
MYKSCGKKTSNFKSLTDASIQKRQGSSAAIEYMDNRQSAVAQMKFEKNPVQRKLTMQGGFDGAVFDGETDDETLRDFADELLGDDPEYAQNNIDRDQIFTVLRDLANNGDHTLYDWQIKDLLIPKDVSDGSGSDEEQFDESDESDESNESNEGNEEPVSNNIVIGKRVFDRDYWHHTVKETIKSTIGVNKLSLLAYRDSKHHNFDFWIGKDGSIFVGGNGTGGNEVSTGYVLTMADKVVKG